MNRASGILLSISSLPSKYGIGCFSKEAYEFVDQLKEGGQSFWQILPLGPTGFGDSPYQAFSAFAGNPYFIDLEQLIQVENVQEILYLYNANTFYSDTSLELALMPQSSTDSTPDSIETDNTDTASASSDNASADNPEA